MVITAETADFGVAVQDGDKEASLGIELLNA